jgi:copper chaperone NosL
MKPFVWAALSGALILAGCQDRDVANAPPPPPVELTANAVGHYCGMRVVEHSGPKGQIILASRKEPVWFSSARDAFSFTMLPEEAKDIRAIYVSDMAKAPSWDKPGTANWIDAKQASYVISSRARGGMGADEAVPFSDMQAAKRFAAENGGQVVSFGEMPRDYILNASAEPSAGDNHPPAGHPAGHDAGGAKSGHHH